MKTNDKRLSEIIKMCADIVVITQTKTGVKVLRLKPDEQRQ